MNKSEFGYIICDKCKGIGNLLDVVKCQKCYGSGKLNWIENIFGKEPEDRYKTIDRLDIGYSIHKNIHFNFLLYSSRITT